MLIISLKIPANLTPIRCLMYVTLVLSQQIITPYIVPHTHTPLLSFSHKVLHIPLLFTIHRGRLLRRHSICIIMIYTATRMVQLILLITIKILLFRLNILHILVTLLRNFVYIRILVH